MGDTALILFYGVMIMLFGIFQSVSFCGVKLSKKNSLSTLCLCLFCGILQLISYYTFSEEAVWKLYPVITHLPCILFLHIFYRKTVTTALASIFTSYLLCQPSKWFGILARHLSGVVWVEYLTRSCCAVIIGVVAILYLSPCLSRIFSKDRRSVCIFGLVPFVYYLFDYATNIYTDFLYSSSQLTVEFLPFFLCITFVLFCILYHGEYEQKSDAERKEQIIRIAVEQQAKEIESVRRSEQELRLLRHDMRLFLDSISMSIEEGSKEKTQEMIRSYTSHINATRVAYFCSCDTINYVLSAFSAKCAAQKIVFSHDVALNAIEQDEILFSSILCNALDNAYNAQLELEESRRNVKLLLKTVDGKLLMSVKNPVARVPVFVDGLPISTVEGHGYGTQSIRYMTERLGGNCQFSVHDGIFAVRVIL